MSESYSYDVPRSGLCIAQPVAAFRYGAEAFWLAGLGLQLMPQAKRALDLGTGSGVMAVLLASVGLETIGIDNHQDWVPAWRETVARSDTVGAFTLVQSDVKMFSSADKFGLVLANPPFFSAKSGPVSPNEWKAAARTEKTATLADFVIAGLSCLSERGKMLLVVPRERHAEVVTAAHAEGGKHASTIFVGAKRVIVVLDRYSRTHTTRTVSDDGDEVGSWYARVGCSDRSL